MKPRDLRCETSVGNKFYTMRWLTAQCQDKVDKIVAKFEIHKDRAAAHQKRNYWECGLFFPLFVGVKPREVECETSVRDGFSIMWRLAAQCQDLFDLRDLVGWCWT